MVGVISEEELNSRVSQIISPEMYFPDIVNLPGDVVVGHLVVLFVFLMLIEVYVSRGYF